MLTGFEGSLSNLESWDRCRSRGVGACLFTGGGKLPLDVEVEADGRGEGVAMAVESKGCTPMGAHARFLFRLVTSKLKFQTKVN